jgi:hypothetical protein
LRARRCQGCTFDAAQIEHEREEQQQTAQPARRESRMAAGPDKICIGIGITSSWCFEAKAGGAPRHRCQHRKAATAGVCSAPLVDGAQVGEDGEDPAMGTGVGGLGWPPVRGP